MKKILLPVLILVMGFSLQAQDAEKPSSEGKIIFEEVMKLEIKLEGAAAQFADQLPKERRNKKELLFNEKSSLYQNVNEEESAEDIAMEGGGGMVQMRMMQPDNILFHDISGAKTVEKKDFMTRTFLIEGEVKQGEWKVTGEQDNILGYPCMQAVKENEEGEKTIAWFSPSIPVASGPSNFIGLPGMVLKVEMNEGDHVITAVSVDFSEVDKDLLVKPKKGKKVTMEEYDEIVAKKMEEMGAEQGEGKGTFMIQIHR